MQKGAEGKATIIHAIDTSIQRLKNEGITKVAVLASLSSYKNQLFEKSFEKVYGSEPYELLFPTDEEKQILYYQGIYPVKAGKRGRELYLVIKPMVERMMALGVQKIIMGCSEIPIIFEDEDFGDLTYDNLEETAIVAIQKCRS